MTNCTCRAKKGEGRDKIFFGVAPGACAPTLLTSFQRHWLWRYQNVRKSENVVAQADRECGYTDMEHTELCNAHTHTHTHTHARTRTLKAGMNRPIKTRHNSQHHY